MNTADTNPPPDVQDVRITDDTLTFDLEDGRSISVPLLYYPTLLLASKAERKEFEICGSSVYWPRLDADLGSEHLLRGCREAAASVEKAHQRAASRKRSHQTARTHRVRTTKALTIK